MLCLKGVFLNELSILMHVLLIEVCMNICELLVYALGSYTVVNQHFKKISSVAFKTSKTYFPFPGNPSPQSITIFYA